MSYMSAIRLLDKLGENHDAEVYKWKNSLLAHNNYEEFEYSGTNILMCIHVNTFRISVCMFFN